MKDLNRILLTLAFAMIFMPFVQAQYGRIYSNVPRNDNYFQLHYYNTLSNSWAEQSIPSGRLQSITNVGSLSYTRVMNIFGRTGGPGIVIPCSSMLSFNEETDTITYRTNGFGDPSFTFDCNIFGGPSLKETEYVNHVPKSYMSAHYVMTFPWGNYSDTRSTNIGANRYTYKFTLNYSITTMKGNNWLDIYGSVKLSSKNRSYMIDKILSQQPIYGFEIHYSQNVFEKALGKGCWFNIGAIYNGGGRIRINDIEENDQNSLKLCGAIAFPTWKHGSIILSYNNTVWSLEGSPITHQLIIQVNCPFVIKSER